MKKVSVIIPCRNEEKFIEQCIKGFINQDYKNFEVIFVDGLSSDNTVKIIKSHIKTKNNFKIISNEKSITPAAFNKGIEAASGDIITIFSAHSYPAIDYISKGVEALEKTGADCVGGNMRAISETNIGKAISAATSHFFGVGNSRFHYYEKECEVDTVYQGFYKKEIFKKIGVFDPILVRDQDDEFNYRLRKNGGKIILSPDIKSNYYSRSSLKSLFKQYYQYGLYKIIVLKKHPLQMKLRHFIPFFFVLSLLLSIAGLITYFSTNNKLFLSPLIFPLLYFILNFTFSLIIALKKCFVHFFILPLIFFIVHFSYGLGFLLGIFIFGFRKISE